MKRKALLFFIALLPFLSLRSQDSTATGIAGYHIGIVQPILAAQNGEVHYINEANFYAIGFPMGITLHTSGKALIDLEFVPFIKPYANTSTPYDVHLLVHPGILIPMGDRFTFGFRLAFETGQGQFGFTPLINKAFSLGDHSVFFVELVAPARFGPEKNSGYTQALALHLGFGF